EHFWSGILDPVGFVLFDNITRYWTVLEKNTQLVPWGFGGYSPGVFLYNRILWTVVGLISLGVVWRLFPMSVEALTARSQSRRAAKARQVDADEAQPIRTLVAAALPRVRHVFGATNTFPPSLTLTRVRVRMTMRELPCSGTLAFVIAVALSRGNI